MLHFFIIAFKILNVEMTRMNRISERDFLSIFIRSNNEDSVICVSQQDGAGVKEPCSIEA